MARTRRPRSELSWGFALTHRDSTSAALETLSCRRPSAPLSFRCEDALERHELCSCSSPPSASLQISGTSLQFGECHLVSTISQYDTSDPDDQRLGSGMPDASGRCGNC